MKKSTNFLNLFFSDCIAFISYSKLSGPFHKYSKNQKQLKFRSIVLFLLKERSLRFAFILRIFLSIHNRFFSSILKSIILLLYNSEISQGASLGPFIFFPHPSNIIIGGRAKLRGKCIIFHSVTIGKKLPGLKGGMPSIGSEVIIGSNSTILGDIRIANRVVIGANTVVTQNVASNQTIVGESLLNRVYFR